MNSSVISATAFRSNIFQFLDEAFKKGETLKIKRKNQIFKIIPDTIKEKEPVKKKKFILSEFKGNPNATTGPDDFDTFVTPTEWNEPNIL
jgi:hypothetical protein